MEIQVSGFQIRLEILNLRASRRRVSSLGKAMGSTGYMLEPRKSAHLHEL